MGAWGAGNFQNDHALDWIGDLIESGDWETVRAALLLAIKPPPCPQPSFIARLLSGARRVPDYLRLDSARAALAAAEIVAIRLDHPSTDMPEDAAKWAREHSISFTPEFIPLARQAVAAIHSRSELKEFVEEGKNSHRTGMARCHRRFGARAADVTAMRSFLFMRSIDG